MVASFNGLGHIITHMQMERRILVAADSYDRLQLVTPSILVEPASHTLHDFSGCGVTLKGCTRRYEGSDHYHDTQAVV